MVKTLVRRGGYNPIFDQSFIKAAGKGAYKVGQGIRKMYIDYKYKKPSRPTSSAKRRLSKRKVRGRMRVARATAVRGVYKGKIRNPKRKVTKNVFALKGIETQFEANGDLKDKHCVYVGHGTSAQQAYQNLWGAVFRSLLNLAGIQIVNWNDKFEPWTASNVRYYVHYSVDEGASESAINVVGPNPGTFFDHLNVFLGAIKPVQAANLDGLIWRRVTMFAGDDLYPAARMDLTYYHVVYENNSKMKIQNRTSARKDIGEADGDDDSADNVEACPLTGRVYEQSKWMNGFVYTNPRSGFGTRDSLNTNDEGIITGFPFLMDTNDTLNVFRKPPVAYYMGQNIKSKTVKLDPGSIKDIKFTFRAKGLFNTLTRKLQAASDPLRVNKITLFGKAQVFALEKELSIGLDDNTDVRVGFQIDQIHRCYGYVSHMKANPLSNVSY